MAKGIPLPVTVTNLDAEISNAVKKVGTINIPVSVDPTAFKKLAQPLGRVSGLATEFEKSIAASNARVLAFGASVGIINGVQNAFASLLQTGIEVQKTLAEIAAISGQSGEALAKFGDSLFEIGKLTGQSFKTAAQAALEFSRQGLSTEETLKRTTDALTLTRFTTLNAAEAVDVLTAAANSFGDTGITTTEILNKLVAVDTKFAVSAEDLANGLARAGSIAQEVGVSFDELNAAITVAQERTARGGSVIGNALKTIFTRLRSDETVQALRSIGVESLNAQGGLKGAIPLLEEVAQKLEGLSEGERVQILEAIASKYNINILSAILTDLSDANKKFGEIVGISASAGNQAYERQIELNKILDAQINITTLSVQQLFNKLAEIGVTESLTNLLKFVNGLLDGINKILDSESTGGNIAKGLIKGISEIFFTVGLPLLGAIFVKLTKDIAQFGVESLKTILGINQQVRERQALEQAVVNTLIRDQEIMATILSLSGNRAKQEEYLLSVYNRQLAALQQVQSIAAGVAPALQAAGLSATSGTVKRRAAEGYLPAAEARDVRRGVGGASPSSKVVEIPNFSFGGGKRGTMVANTSEYIVPNYAGGSGTAIFNQDMAKEYGLPPGAKKITASGGFIPASGFVPNFADSGLKGIGGLQGKELPYNVKKNLTPAEAKKVERYFEKTVVESAAKNPYEGQVDVAHILAGRIFESRAQGLEYIDLQENDPKPDIKSGPYSVAEAKLSYQAGLDDPRLAKGGEKGDKLLVPKTAKQDENINKKLSEKGVTAKKHGSIGHSFLFAKAKELIQRYRDTPREEIIKGIGGFGPNKIPIFDSGARSVSENASTGYIPNFINSGFVWTGTGERLEGYDPEGVIPAGNATRGKKWERVKANYRPAKQEELDAFAAKAAKQMNENISVTAQHPAGAVMLVPKQEQAAIINKDSQSFGFKPKDGLKTPEGEGINFVKFAAFGVNDEKFKSKSGAKMSDIQMRIKNAIGSIGADIANDFKVLTKEPLDKDGFYKLFDKKQGAGGSVSAVAGSIFEAATDYTLNPAGNPDFSDPDTSFDVGSLTPNLIDVFDIKGDYGPGTKADFKISEARARAFADQVVLNKVYKKVDKTTGLAKAAKGYIPNFAGKYYYDPNLITKEDDVVKGEDGKDIKNATLKKALTSRKKINVLIGPVGSGKTTFAQASGGTFLRKPSDVDLADEITILQTSHTSTKTGGISDNMRQILDAATGQISYLDVSDEVISERRKVRSAQAEAGQIVDDTRSTKQIVSGDQFAEKKSPTFIQAVQEYLKTKGKTLNMIKGSEGYIPNFALTDPLSSLATAKQFKNDSSSNTGLEESINTAAKNAYKPFSKRRNITAGVSKNLVGNEAGTKKFRDALNSGISIADFIGFQAATVGAPRPNISGKPEDLEKDLASLRFFNKDINGPRPALRAVTTNPDESEVLAPASQFYDLKTAIGFAKAATVSLTQTPVGRKAAEGYIPNFASQNAIDAMRRIISDPAAPQGEKDAAVSKLAQVTKVTSSGNPRAAAQKIVKTKLPITQEDKDYLNQNKEKIVAGMGRSFGMLFNLDALEMGDLNYVKRLDPSIAKKLSEIVQKQGGRDSVRSLIDFGSAARGYIPNFAENEPLKEAIDREVAAGVSPARVRVTQDDRLQNSKNPEGLAVINTRDEPNGKIPNNFRKRAAVQEVASRGFVPNFAEGVSLKGGTKFTTETQDIMGGAPISAAFPRQELEKLRKVLNEAVAAYEAEIKAGKDVEEAKKKLNEATNKATREANLSKESASKVQSAVAKSAGGVVSGDGKSAKGLADSAEKTKVGLDKMFYALSGITTLSYTLQSVFKDSESAVAKFTIGVASAAQTASQFALAGGAIRDLTENLADKGGAFATLGKIGKYAGPVGAVLGAGVGIYQAVEENRKRTEEARASDVAKKYQNDIEIQLEALTNEGGARGGFIAGEKEAADAIVNKLQAERDALQAQLDKINEFEVARSLGRAQGQQPPEGNEKQIQADLEKVDRRLKDEKVIQKNATERAKKEEDEATRRENRKKAVAQVDTANLTQRLILEQELGRLSEAFSKAENDALLTRVRNRIKINEQVLLGTQYQKDEAALQLKLSDFENQKEDAKKATLEATIKELAGMSSLANVDKIALNQLIEKIKANKSLVGLEQEINALKGDGILRAKTALETQTNTLNRNLASIEAKKEELALVDAYERKSKAILATEQLINQGIAERIQSRDKIRSIEQESAIQQANLRRQIPIAQLESQISTQPFATPQQEYELLALRNRAKVEQETAAITDAARKRQANQAVELRGRVLTLTESLNYLTKEQKDGVKLSIDAADKIEDYGRRIEVFGRIAQSVQDIKPPRILDIQRTGDIGFEGALQPGQEAIAKQYQQEAIKFSETISALKEEQKKADEEGRKEDALRLELIQKRISYEQKLAEIRARSRAQAGFTRAFDELEKDTQNFTEKLSYETTFAFRDGLRDALGAAISQTDDLNGALQAVAINFLKTLQGKFLNQAADQITLGLGKIDWGSVGKGISNYFQGNSGSGTANAPIPYRSAKGGFVKGYADGGKVIGGSGVRDDVPAMLSAGEYVIRKSAVRKYGEANLEMLNNGGVPKMANGGGFFLPGIRGGTEISGYKDLTAFANQTTTSGATDVLKGGRSTAFANLEDQSQRLSAYALLNQDDLINQEIRSAQEQGLTAIRQREAYRTAQRKAIQKEIVGTILAAAVSYGMSKIPIKTGSGPAAGNQGAVGVSYGYQDNQAGYGPKLGTQSFSSWAATKPSPLKAYGGLIKHYNAGGGPTDDIPALLMGGEYVMSRQTTRKYGKQFFDSINQGRAPRFAEGGSVPTSESSYAEKAASSSETKTRNAPNVTININVTKDSSTTETQGSDEEADVNYKRMSEQIKAIVLDTINEEKRLGGSLRSRS